MSDAWDPGQFDLAGEPLDRPHPDEIDWGGDGSEPDRPRRAHVLEALRPSRGPWAPPLDRLLALGDVDQEDLDRIAEELQIGQAHAPELARMVRDRDLSTAEDDSAWAPIHALALLSRLDMSATSASSSRCSTWASTG